MGGKILWNVITGKRTWSKQILKKKYFTGDKERCLERATKVQKGSPIFSLCKKAIPHFISKLTWIPGNGEKIHIWDDSILGDQPLNGVSDLGKLKIGSLPIITAPCGIFHPGKMMKTKPGISGIWVITQSSFRRKRSNCWITCKENRL